MLQEKNWRCTFSPPTQQLLTCFILLHSAVRLILWEFKRNSSVSQTPEVWLTEELCLNLQREIKRTCQSLHSCGKTFFCCCAFKYKISQKLQHGKRVTVKEFKERQYKTTTRELTGRITNTANLLVNFYCVSRIT